MQSLLRLHGLEGQSGRLVPEEGKGGQQVPPLKRDNMEVLPMGGVHEEEKRCLEKSVSIQEKAKYWRDVALWQKARLLGLQ